VSDFNVATIGEDCGELLVRRLECAERGVRSAVDDLNVLHHPILSRHTNVRNGWKADATPLNPKTTMRRTTLVLSLCILASCTPTEMYCGPFMATSELDGTLRVTVRPADADEFNRRIVAFLRSKGFSYESSASDTYLGPSDPAGRQITFRNIKTIGCTSRAVIWSENVIRPDEFIVTVHHTAFGNRGSSAKLMADLKETAAARSR
jgi:hypothetical protein